MLACDVIETTVVRAYGFDTSETFKAFEAFKRLLRHCETFVDNPRSFTVVGRIMNSLLSIYVKVITI